MSHRLNAFGQLVSAVGDGEVSIDGGVIGYGGAPCWLDDRRVIYNGHDPVTGAWSTLVYNTITGATTVLLLGGGEFLAAGGGRYAVQLGGVVTASFSVRAGARMSLVGTEGRGAAAADGTIALCSDASCTSFDLYAPDGSWVHVDAIAYGLCVIGPGRAVWTGGSVGVDYRPARPMASPKWVTVGGEDWLVGWVDGVGLVAQVNGAIDGYVLASDGTQFDVDARAVNGELLVAWSRSNAERPIENVKRVVDRTQPRVPIAPPAPAVPAIGRALVMGWFHFGGAPETAPGNATLQVDPDMLLRDRAMGRPLAVYAAGNPEGDIVALERAIAAAAAARPTLPVLAYWTAGVQRVRVPVPPPGVALLVGVEAYRWVSETLADFEMRVRLAVSLCPTAMLIAQCYTSNAAQTTDLASLVPVYARLARDCRNVLGILSFSSGSRATGWDAQGDDVHDAWKALYASVTGLPALPAPSAQPPTPKPAPPPPVPRPSPATRFPAARLYGVPR